MRDRSRVSDLFVRATADLRSARTEAVHRALKDVGDTVLALILLGLAMPLLLAVAIIVRLSGPGDLLYAHDRIGRDGRPFRCFKFRTMYADAPQRLATLLANDPVAAATWSRTRKLDHDPRISPAGRLLRQFSLDELPQLINVLSGEMSLVGPRPITREELSRYGTSARHYLAVKPGITGLWQTSGRNDLSYGERVRLDTLYARNRSPLSDMLILLRTPWAVLTRRGAR